MTKASSYRTYLHDLINDTVITLMPYKYYS